MTVFLVCVNSSTTLVTHFAFVKARAANTQAYCLPRLISSPVTLIWMDSRPF